MDLFSTTLDLLSIVLTPWQLSPCPFLLHADLISGPPWCLITTILNNKSLLSREIFGEITGQNKEQKQKQKSCLQMQKRKHVETTNFSITRNVPGVSSCAHSSLIFFLFLSILLSLFLSASASRCTPPMSVALIWGLSLRYQLRQCRLSFYV